MASDGPRAAAEYAAALASRAGPNRFEPETGKLYIGDRVEARIALGQLADGTWTVDIETLCMRPPTAEEASPYPTPGLDEATG